MLRQTVRGRSVRQERPQSLSDNVAATWGRQNKALSSVPAPQISRPFDASRKIGLDNQAGLLATRDLGELNAPNSAQRNLEVIFTTVQPMRRLVRT